MENAEKKFTLFLSIAAALLLSFCVFLAGCGKGGSGGAPVSSGTQVEEKTHYGCGVTEEGHCPHCDEGRPDAECICGGHSFVIESDKLMCCPVCKRPIKKIEPKDLPTAMHAVKPSVDGEVVSRLKLKPGQARLTGIKTVVVGRQHLFESIRAVGMVAYDPELAVAQEEFLTAVETRQKVRDSSDADVIRRADDLVEKSRFKLKLMGMSDKEISALQSNGRAQLNLVLPEDKAWVYADVYEADLGWVKPGQEAVITATAYPEEEFKGTVASISPVLDQKTRSARVRIEADNAGKKLKPKMYADVLIKSVYLPQDGPPEALAVPAGAVLNTGVRKIVYVLSGDGEYLGREVTTGPKATAMIDGKHVQMYPVLSGLRPGEIVVTEGNFLIDSQSQISGTASVAYGGALGKEEKKAPQMHQH